MTFRVAVLQSHIRNEASMSDQKRALRRRMHAQRDALSDRTARSATIKALVEALPVYQCAAAIHCFLTIKSEVETGPLIDAALASGKAVAVPFIDQLGTMHHSWLDSLYLATLTTDALGVPQPANLRPAIPGDWQLTLVPMLAFDRAGYRLGYGKGYYDQLLASVGGAKVGLAFACQEVATLPRELHDHPLDLIVTEAGLIIPERSTVPN